MTMVSIALALLAAAPPEPAPPAASDKEVWALARNVDSAPAYEVYLRRFPDGAHRKEALEASYRVQVLPIVEGPPPPTFATPPQPDTCTPLLTAQAMKTADSAEAREYLAVRRANRPASFEAYIAKYPAGACAADAASRLFLRCKAREGFKPIAGFGPLASHRLSQVIFNEEDFPARARRAGESGRVIAEWEVAEDGHVEDCRIVQSSGSAVLDETSCRLATARMRYDPARDRDGAPARSTDGHHFHWTPPPD